MAGTIPCEEYTMCKLDCNYAAEFVALELIRDWARQKPLTEQSPILKADVTRVGISN